MKKILHEWALGGVKQRDDAKKSKTQNYSKLYTMLKLYGFLYSPPSRACFTFLKMYDIPFEFKSVNAWEHENETKQFRDMNPLGTFSITTFFSSRERERE